MENCSALVEYDNGTLELIRYDGTVIDRLPASETQRNAHFEDDVFDPLPWGIAVGEEDEPVYYPPTEVLVA